MRKILESGKELETIIRDNRGISPNDDLSDVDVSNIQLILSRRFQSTGFEVIADFITRSGTCPTIQSGQNCSAVIGE